MARFRRRSISNDLEKKIIIGLVTSKQFCNEIASVIDAEYFQIDYAKIVARWAVDFFRQYKEPIGRAIEDVFKTEKENVEPEHADLIATFLSNISSDYETDGFNSDYYADAAREYFRFRSMEILFEKGKSALAAKRPDIAEDLIRGHSKIRQKTTEIFNPFDSTEIKFHDPESQRLFRFHGAIGKLFGWFNRTWLVAVSAPEKRGKTFILEEIAIEALTNKLKVLEVSLEMNKEEKKERLYRRITGLPEEEILETVFPVFDCEHSQFGTCKMKSRANKGQLINDDGEKPEYDTKLKYRPCTICREKGRFDRYRMDWWFTTQGVTPARKTRDILNKAKELRRLFGDNLRIVSFPAFSANFDDIVAAMDDLEMSEGFVPDVVIIDYFDIMAEEKGRFNSDRALIDARWKRGKNFAATRKVCVFTADQAKKIARQKQSIDTDDTSEDKRKDAHLDMRIGLNQTPKEKEDGIMRLNVLFHRHMKYNERREVACLQYLDLGQPLLDSEFWPHDKKIKNL